MNGTFARDARYLELLLGPMRECARYRPVFGQQAGEGVSLPGFRTLYGADPLYHWVGLDSDLMYAAHKAAGGMTSIYRQLGIGCERLLRGVIQDEMAVDDEQVAWSYEYARENNSAGTHTLDARIDVEFIRDEASRARMRAWLDAAGESLGLSQERRRTLRGIVLEVRQGYKSADSKRQNADLRFGMRAYNEGYLPAICVVSTQASEAVCRRYRAALLLVLLGTVNRGNTESTFAFYRDVVGYDLAEFFRRNTDKLREEFGKVLRGLLTPA